MRFVGRRRELAALTEMLRAVEEDGHGKAVLLRGRRRVGKSRLVEEFCRRSDVPYVFHTATTRPPEQEIPLFVEEILRSTLPDAGTAAGQRPTSWDAALRLLAAVLPRDRVSVVVLDELPYLTTADPDVESTLQKAFDRDLSRLPVLLVGIGSDLAMMEALNEYGRPFHQRAREMVVPPLSPAEVGELLDLGPADAVDAALVTGGLPLVCEEWPRGATLRRYLGAALRDPTSALVVSAERSLAAEFPALVQAREVLGVVGAGERTFSAIARVAGLAQPSLQRSLEVLTAKRIIAVDRPVSTRASRETRYRVADPYLRFWLAFIGPHLAELERARSDLVLRRVEEGWSSWRGRAVEPLVRESLERMPEAARPGGAPIFGGWWTRSNSVEVDLVGVDRDGPASRVLAVGSVKWRERQPFDRRDLSALVTAREGVPGADADTPLVVASRSGLDDGLDAVVRLVTPEEIVEAWRDAD